MIFGYSTLGFGSGGKAYDPDAILHFKRMQSSNPNLLDAINTLIVTLKFYGIWSLLDCIIVVCDNENDSLLNLKGATYDATNVNGAVFTIDRGFDPVAVGADAANPGYINTNLIVNSSTLASDYNNSQFVYQRTSQSSNAVYLMGVSASNPFAMYYDGSVSPDVQVFNSNNFFSVTSTNDAAVGFIGGTRRANNDVDIRVNGVNTNDTNIASNAPIDAYPIFVGANNNAGTPELIAVGHQMAAWGIGGGLTPTQHAVLETAIQTYMTARGSAV